MKNEDLKLDAYEIMRLFIEEGVEISKEEVEEVLKYTKGWKPAIDIAVKAYQEGGSVFSTGSLQNFLEKCNFDKCTEEVNQGIMKLSILEKFTLDQAMSICKSKDTLKVITELEENHVFVGKSDYQNFYFEPLLKECLKQNLLTSDVDIDGLYKEAGTWLETKRRTIEAIALYLDNNDFDEIIRVIENMLFNFMDIEPDLSTEVFKRMPMEYKYNNPYIYLSHIFDNVTNVDVYTGLKMLNEFKRDLDRGLYKGDKKQLLGEYYIIKGLCEYNDVVPMMKCFHLADEAFDGGQSKVASPQMVATFGSCHLLYLYHHTPGELKKLVEVIKDDVACFVRISNGVNGGSDLQTEAEYSFEIGEFKKALALSRVGAKEANRNRQTSIYICAIFLQGRWGLIHENKSMYNEAVRDLKLIYKETPIQIIKAEIECALAYLYIINGNTEDVAEWIKAGDDFSPRLLHEAWGVAYVIKILYNLKRNDFEEAINCANILETAYMEMNHALGVLVIKMARSVSSYYIGDAEEGYQALHELLQMAKADNLTTFFLEFYDMLITVFREYEPKDEFEKEIKDMVESRYTEQNKLKPEDMLTQKETEVVKLFIDSMTSKEVAERLMISDNTVRTHLKNIYTKLGINKKTELIRLFDRRKRVIR